MGRRGNRGRGRPQRAYHGDGDQKAEPEVYDGDGGYDGYDQADDQCGPDDGYGFDDGPEGDGHGKIRPRDIGFFNPALDDSDGAGILSSEGTTIYTEVFAFTDRLRIVKVTQGIELVRNMWHMCL